MDETQSTLLIRIRNRDDASAWQEFIGIYEPLIERYARKRGLSREDAEDVRGQTMEAVVRQIGEFQYDKAKGGFRNWLRRIACNKIVDMRRKRRLEVPADSAELRMTPDRGPTPEEEWDLEWAKHHLNYCVEQVKREVSERNYRAFRMLVYEEKDVGEVCEALGINANQAYKAKSRVLERVREKMAELGVDEE